MDVKSTWDREQYFKDLAQGRVAGTWLEGWFEGLDKGRLETTQSLLCRTLERRFGRLEGDTLRSLTSLAHPGILHALFDFAVDASSLEDFIEKRDGLVEVRRATLLLNLAQRFGRLPDEFKDGLLALDDLDRIEHLIELPLEVDHEPALRDYVLALEGQAP